MKKLLLPVILAPLVAFAFASAPGMVVTTVSKDLASGETWSSTMSVQANDLAMEFNDPRSEASGSLVYLADGGEWIMNNDQDQTYFQMDRATLDQMATQVAAAMAQVEQMLESIPESQRAAIMNSGIPGMEMLADGGLPVIELRETGETDTKAGYPVERFDMYVGDKLTQQQWVTDWSNVAGSEKIREAMTGFANMMKSFLESMPTGMFGDGGIGQFMEFDRGVPVVTYEIGDDGAPTVESTMTEFTETDVDRSLFGPKPGYTKQDINFGMN